MAAAELNNILYVTTDCVTFYCVALYSQLPRRSGSSEIPDDHAGACYKLSEYSCFEKGCPTKPYATMPKGIMGNGGLWYLIEALGVSAT